MAKALLTFVTQHYDLLFTCTDVLYVSDATYTQVNYIFFWKMDVNYIMEMKNVGMHNGLACPGPKSNWSDIDNTIRCTNLIEVIWTAWDEQTYVNSKYMLAWRDRPRAGGGGDQALATTAPPWLLVPRIRYLGFTTQGKKGPLTTTGDLSACKSKRTLIQLLTVIKPLFLAPLPGNKWSRFNLLLPFVIFSFLLVFLFASTNLWSSSKSI
jgi:hypothetical protein